MANCQQEEELRASQDPKYQHLQEDLHVEITAFAPPAEAFAEISDSWHDLPDSNDVIRELEMITVLDTLKQQAGSGLDADEAREFNGAAPPPPLTPPHFSPRESESTSKVYWIILK